MTQKPYYPTLSADDDAAFCKYVVPGVDTYDVYNNQGRLIERTVRQDRALTLARQLEEETK